MDNADELRLYSVRQRFMNLSAATASARPVAREKNGRRAGERAGGVRGLTAASRDGLSVSARFCELRQTTTLREVDLKTQDWTVTDRVCVCAVFIRVAVWRSGSA